MEKSSSITIRDLAKIAGVNHSTVSRALNGSPLVKEETRKKIQRLADELQFSFHTGARSLRGVKTGIIALIYPRVLDTFGNSLYTQQLFLDLRTRLEAMELDTVLVSAGNSETGESHVQRLIRQNRIDGFLIVHGGLLKTDYERIREAGLPLVQVHNRPRNISVREADCFFTDNREGGRLAAGHLLDVGARRIINLEMECGTDTAGRSGTPGETEDRTSGYRDALAAGGIEPDPEWIHSCPCDFGEAYRFVYRNRDLFRRADGLFAHADILAFGAMTALKELRIDVPGRIRVVGFDDTALSEMPPGGISTIHQPREELAESAVVRLHALLQGAEELPRTECLLRPRLIVRGSSEKKIHFTDRRNK